MSGIDPEKLRHILEELGPTYVKLGQINYQIVTKFELHEAFFRIQLLHWMSGENLKNFFQIYLIMSV